MPLLHLSFTRDKNFDKFFNQNILKISAIKELKKKKKNVLKKIACK